MRRTAIPLALFAILIGFFIFGLSRDPSKLPSVLIGKPAPAFSLPALNDPNERVDHRVWQGEYALINVWATWCRECIVEHAFLLELAKTSGVPIIGLNWNDDRAKALGWLQRLGDPYRAVGFDNTGRVAIDWGVYGAPETFLVDPQGIVLHKHLGAMTPKVWENEFLPKIAQNNAAQ